MLNRNSDTLRTRASILALPVESRIEYIEEIVDDLARSIWGDSFNEADKRKMESSANKMLHSVKRAKELALDILRED